MRSGGYAEAISSFLYIKGLPVTTNYKALAEARLAEIRQVGQKRLSQVDKDIQEKNYMQAVGSLKGIIKEFNKSSVAHQARAKRSALLKDPKVVKLLREMEANEIYAQAESREGQKLYYQALLLYEKVADTYGDTESGKKAKKLLAEWKADAEFMALVREQEAKAHCKGWFSLAESYSKLGVNDKALEFYQKIIDAYPDTVYGKRASDRIASLQID